MQEVITLAVFVPFAIFYMGQPFKLDFLWAAAVSSARSTSCSGLTRQAERPAIQDGLPGVWLFGVCR